MASEQERLKALIEADVATEDDKKRYAELTAAPTRDEVAAPPPAPSAEEEPVATGELIGFEDSVDEEVFKRGGSQYYMPSEEGFFKSRLVEVIKPSFSKKDAKWFIFETTDPKLKAQGRGVIVAEFTTGAFKLKDVLDGLAIAYTVTAGIVKYGIKLPLDCYADWSRDAKGVGEVRISGLRTLEAGAAVEKAI